MNYEEAVAYINDTPRFTTKNTLENTRMVLERLGHPERQMKLIHVAGSNGKGSVCAYLSSILTTAGRRTGLFTSPHLVDINERFQLNQEPVTDALFLEAFEKVMNTVHMLLKECPDRFSHPTFFELLFLMGMCIFEKCRMEYVVLETGLGGRFDATNVIEKPLVSVITSISLEHTEYLGDTYELIAGEKAGILRPGVPVVYSAGQKEAARRIEECAAGVGAETVPLPEHAIKEIKIQHKTIDFSLHLNYYDYIGFTVSMPAVYQAENAALAVTALVRLGDGRITVPVMQEGIRKTAWEGRMEEILPSVFLDGAHNIDGIRAFLETVRLHPCKGKRKLLYSVVRDKKYQAVTEAVALSGLFHEIGVVALKDERALPLTILEDSYRQYTGFICRAYDDLDSAFRELVREKDDEDMVYIVGSLYLAGEIKALLRRPRHD